MAAENNGPEVEPKGNDVNGPSGLEEKIIRQIEYYFGDINLSRDKFLQEKIKEDDGWVPLEVMLKFNRLASISKDSEVIVAALAKSDSGLMEISEDKSKIRRSPNRPLPEMNEERRKELMARTVYCKGFPLEGVDVNKLLDFFPQYGKVEYVIMRNYHDKATQNWCFKGSVFVMFPIVEEAAAFLKLESVKYEDKELIRMWQSEYTELKKKERLEEKMKHHLKKVEGKKDGKKIEEPEKDEEGFQAGSVLHLKEITGELKREDIKQKIQSMGYLVAFIDFNMGEEEAWVRLTEPMAKQILETLKPEEGLIKFEKGEAKAVPMEEEEEAEFLENAKEKMLKRRNMVKNTRKGGKQGGHRGGRGNWNLRKRKGCSDGDGPTPSKVTKCP